MTTTPAGAFTFVLHSHLPYARQAKTLAVADGTANALVPGLVKAPELDHLDAPGGQATPWLDAIWFRSRDAFFRLTDVVISCANAWVGHGERLGFKFG